MALLRPLIKRQIYRFILYHGPCTLTIDFIAKSLHDLSDDINTEQIYNIQSIIIAIIAPYTANLQNAEHIVKTS